LNREIRKVKLLVRITNGSRFYSLVRTLTNYVEKDIFVVPVVRLTLLVITLSCNEKKGWKSVLGSSLINNHSELQGTINNIKKK
jgi:hypothetical protein